MARSSALDPVPPPAMMGSFGELVARYGYALVALVVLAESIGLPLPGETALLTAAALAARGTLSLTGVIAAAALGTVLGGSGGYWVGQRGGPAFLHRYGRLLRMDGSKIDSARVFFDRHGAATVFFGRFVLLLRMFAGILAGMAQMPFGRFSLYNTLGGLAWSVTFGITGYLFGRNLPRLVHGLGRASLLVGLLVLVLVVAAAVWRWLYAESAEAGARLSRWWVRAAGSPRFVSVRLRHPMAWRLVVERFARGEYLALHLAAGFLVSMGALGVLAALTEDVVQGDPMTMFDLLLALRLRLAVSDGTIAALHQVSFLGSPLVLTTMFVAVGAALTVRGRWLSLATWAAAFTGASLLETGLRLVMHRARSPVAPGWPHELAFHFPSTHALGALVGYGLLAHFVFISTTRTWLRASAVATVAAVVAGVGASRLILGIHFFGDLVGGYTAGIIWLTACITGLEIARRSVGVSRTAVALEVTPAA